MELRYEVIRIPNNPYMDIIRGDIHKTYEEAEKELKECPVEVISGVKWTAEIITHQVKQTIRF